MSISEKKRGNNPNTLKYHFEVYCTKFPNEIYYVYG